MCRLAAYLGPDVTLGQFLLEPAHSLYVQSWAPRELRFAKLNADGFGVGWYGPEGQAARYLNAMPIWSDHNLSALASSLSTGLWLAMVRSATPGFACGIPNTQPFTDGHLLYLHNGFVEHFDQRLRGHIRRYLSPTIEAGIQGNTDSEYLFALLRQILADDASLTLAQAIREGLNQITAWLRDETTLLNLVLTDGERLYATRHAFNAEPPSLYYTTDDEHFPEGAQLIASECLTHPDFWRPVPDHHLLILDPACPPELIPL